MSSPASTNTIEENVQSIALALTSTGALVDSNISFGPTYAKSAVLSGNGDVDAYNPKRTALFIQNLAPRKLYYLFGTGCTASIFSGVLVPDTGAANGYGGSVRISGTDYNGIVSVYDPNPAGPYFVLTITTSA